MRRVQRPRNLLRGVVVNPREARRRPNKATEPHVPALGEQLQFERERLFKAMSVVECCRLACASKYENRNPECMIDALQVAYDIVNQVAGRLGLMSSEGGPGR